ncbi:uncharacterized protein MKK02DRAFT_45569 [Dioszegia hungarica]|uniref:Uncharacterized protein n=1 Tax=Dioszegia hungarica TaxID=4972 RepID=A0AA38HAV1_9TREE|nr:uncharacterized protein MKK02DRAFT_45569 [Dioszegia hungarica]KAI9636861.1 hypothetical protein MKK02DRAFT_45569 [Dioszegia hungarica]
MPDADIPLLPYRSPSSATSPPRPLPVRTSAPSSPVDVVNAVAGPSKPPRVVLAQPISPRATRRTSRSPGVEEIQLSPLGASGKGKAKSPVPDTREIWDLDDPFGKDISGEMDTPGWDGKGVGIVGPGDGSGPHRQHMPVRPALINTQQPSRQPSMSPSSKIKPHIPIQLRPERSTMLGCLDGPTPKNPDDSTWRWLGEHCVGLALCQCFPCGKNAPNY